MKKLAILLFLLLGYGLTELHAQVANVQGAWKCVAVQAVSTKKPMAAADIDKATSYAVTDYAVGGDGSLNLMADNKFTLVTKGGRVNEGTYKIKGKKLSIFFDMGDCTTCKTRVDEYKILEVTDNEMKVSLPDQDYGSNLAYIFTYKK